MVAVVAAIVFLESGRREIPVQYAKRVVGSESMGDRAPIPLENQYSRRHPPIFASSIIAFSGDHHRFSIRAWVKAIGPSWRRGRSCTVDYVGLILFFCFFYTLVVLNPVDMADNMKNTEVSFRHSSMPRPPTHLQV